LPGADLHPSPLILSAGSLFKKIKIFLKQMQKTGGLKRYICMNNEKGNFFVRQGNMRALSE